MLKFRFLQWSSYSLFFLPFHCTDFDFFFLSSHHVIRIPRGLVGSSNLQDPAQQGNVYFDKEQLMVLPHPDS